MTGVVPAAVARASSTQDRQVPSSLGSKVSRARGRINDAIAPPFPVRHRPCVRVQAIVGVALVLLFAAAAAAQPTVTVRAESRLELDIRRAEAGLLVTGALRDDLGVPLAGDEVSLEVSHAIASEHQRGRHVLTRVVTADPEGRFTTTFAVESASMAARHGVTGEAKPPTELTA